MHALCLTTLLGLTVGQNPAPENLDFRLGNLSGWDGKGFALTGGSASKDFAVTSDDEHSPTRTGMIRYVVKIPAGAAKIEFKAYAATAEDNQPDRRLNVVLAGAGKQVAPLMVHSGAGWRPASHLLPRWHGEPRSYAWDVGGLDGQRLQIVIIDRDDRPGSYVYCAGFHVRGADIVKSKDDDFGQYMLALQKKHKLAPMARFDCKRFCAYSNASEPFTTLRLRQCEIFYDLFYNHFQRMGFALHPPAERLMLAVFDSPDGVDAYLGMKLSAGITGMYHPATNRLLLYDLSENRALVAHKKQALEGAKKIASSVDRDRFVTSLERKLDVTVKDVNLTTTMHEAAHQLSFNCGMLNRNGDVAIWLAEGLACYCEATESGEWQAIGAPNSGRIRDLARAHGKYIPLQVLIKEDWRLGRPILLGYAQSWALFRMLLQERPKAMKAYLTLIYTRRTPDYRVADFRQAFGNDLVALEQHYFAYLRNLVDSK